jgi:hypothetical protein
LRFWFSRAFLSFTSLSILHLLFIRNISHLRSLIQHAQKSHFYLWTIVLTRLEVPCSKISSVIITSAPTLVWLQNPHYGAEPLLRYITTTLHPNLIFRQPFSFPSQNSFGNRRLKDSRKLLYGNIYRVDFRLSPSALVSIRYIPVF